MPMGDALQEDWAYDDVDWEMVDRQAAKRQKLLPTGPDQQVHLRHFGEREGDAMIVREFEPVECPAGSRSLYCSCPSTPCASSAPHASTAGE